MVVTMLRGELRALVVEAVAEAMKTAPTDAEWLDAPAVAEILCIAPRSVQKLARRSGLPSHRLGPKLLRYRRSEVLAWLEGRR